MSDKPPFVLDKAIISGTADLGDIAYTHFKHGLMARLHIYMDPALGMSYEVAPFREWTPTLTFSLREAADHYIMASALDRAAFLDTMPPADN